MNFPAVGLAKPVILLAITFGITIFSILYFDHNPSSAKQHPFPSKPDIMARKFILWLHGLGDSGPANEPIKTFFTSTELRNTVWSFPSAPLSPVTCNNGAVMPSWFDIHEIPVTADSPKDERGLLQAVQNVHKMIDKEIEAGTRPDDVFVCGFSQGGHSLSLLLFDLGKPYYVQTPRSSRMFNDFCGCLDVGKCLDVSKNFGWRCSVQRMGSI